MTVPQITDDLGYPLILTPFIEQNKFIEAKVAAQVYLNGFKNIKSFSGFFTVDKIYKSNLFFWFFPARKNYSSAPVIVWLQGGPGASALIGLFVENGPFNLKNDGKSFYLKVYNCNIPIHKAFLNVSTCKI